jgi:hypothetical protein
MDQLLAGPTQFLDAALSSIEAELLSTDTPAVAASDSRAVLEARRAAQAWQKVNLTKERQRWSDKPSTEDAATQLAQLRALLHDVPDPAMAIASALDDAASAAAASEAALAELAEVKSNAARAALAASSHGEKAAQMDAAIRQAASLQEALTTERSARDAAERRAFSAAEQLLGLQAAHTSEVEHLTEELRRLSQRVREAEAEAARARSVVAPPGSNQSAALLEERNAELAAALVVKERASARLSMALAAAKKEATDAASDAATARSEASTHRQATAKLRHELERRPQCAEVEALQRSVAALQSCLHATETAEVVAAAATCTTDAEAAQAAMPALLMGARRRALDAERRAEDLASQLAAAVADLSHHRRRADEAQSSSAEKVALVQRLEADLHACSSLSETGVPAAAPAADGGELSLLDVVRRQRDRLKQRVSQLEDDLASAVVARDMALANTADAALAAKAARMLPSDGMGARRRVAAMMCLGGYRKGQLGRAVNDEEGGVAHHTSTRPAAGLAGRAPVAAAVAYAALLHLALLRAWAQRTC